MLRVVPERRLFRPPARFPAITRDLALLVEERVWAAEIERAARSAAGGLLEAIEPFDLYRGEQVPAGKKSLALSLTYRAADRTLTDQEVDAAHEAVVRAVVEGLAAEVRGAV